MKILVIGYGSIGKRHARNVKALGHELILLRHSRSNPNNDGLKEYYLFEEVIKHEEINGAIICSPTSMHLDDVELLVRHDIPFLLEKPPTADLESMLLMEKLLQNNGFNDYDIGFNLRHYPVLQFIKDFLPNLGEIYSSRIYAGYYLPNWRENVDYKETSSAKKELGGGVHIEFVHEIDYILWFFGCPEKVIAYINKISNLEISTEDICCALLKYDNDSIVELHLDYLSHKYLRGCQIIAENGTLDWDMNTRIVYYFKRNNKISEEIFFIAPDYDFNNTYIRELENFIGIINGKNKSTVNIKNAVNVMKILEAIKISSEKEKWFYLKDVFTC